MIRTPQKTAGPQGGGSDTDKTRPDGDRLAWALVLAGWASVCMAHLYWWSQNLKPLAWDQSVHTLLSLGYLQALASPPTWPDILSLSIHYPPLFHLSQALSFLITDPSLQFAAWVNLFWLLALMIPVWLLGRDIYGRTQGVLAAWLMALIPISAGLTREVLMEPCLASLVAWTVLILHHSAHLRSRKALYGLGALAGLGLLAKWNYPLLVLAPYWFVLWKGRGQGSPPDKTGLIAALLICMALALPWYLHSPRTLIKNLFINAGQVGVQEGDPAVFSLDGWLYYPDKLVNDHLFLGLGLFVLAGVAFSIIRRREGSGLILAWFVGGIVLVSLLGNKDSRYIFPLMPAACLLAVGWLGALRAGWLRTGLMGAALVLGLCAFVGTSFGPACLAEERALDLAGRKLRICGSLAGYSQPPRRETWAVPDILDAVVRDWGPSPGLPKLGSPASLPHFHKGALTSWAALTSTPVKIVSSVDPHELTLSDPPPDPAGIRARIAHLDYLILKNGDAALIQGNLEARLCAACPSRPPGFVHKVLPSAKLIADFPLPDASRAFLFRLERE